MSKAVIVTGVSGGLGSEIATRFGLTGARVDVCVPIQVQSMVEATLDKWGSIDLLVNNVSGDQSAIDQENSLHRTTGSAQELAEFVMHLSTMNNISGQTLNMDSRILF